MTFSNRLLEIAEDDDYRHYLTRKKDEVGWKMPISFEISCSQ